MTIPVLNVSCFQEGSQEFNIFYPTLVGNWIKNHYFYSNKVLLFISYGQQGSHY